MQFSGNPNFTLRSNVVTSAGTGGVFAKLACGNAFVGNSLQGNAGNIGLLFDATTGANTPAGNGTIVIDNGAFDCNGDGVKDPNIITGLEPCRTACRSERWGADRSDAAVESH